MVAVWVMDQKNRTLNGYQFQIYGGRTVYCPGSKESALYNWNSDSIQRLLLLSTGEVLSGYSTAATQDSSGEDCKASIQKSRSKSCRCCGKRAGGGQQLELKISNADPTFYIFQASKAYCSLRVTFILHAISAHIYSTYLPKTWLGLL